MVPTSSLSRIGILTGPTATGKSLLALELASSSRSPIEIVNADSLLIFRGLDIGTAKPSPADRARIPHHLMDLLEPHETFTAGDFHRAAHRVIEDILSRGRRPLIVGGTGFYLKTLLYGLWPAPKGDPELRRKLDAETNAELYRRLERWDPPSALRIGGNDRYRLIRALEVTELGGRTPSELQALEPEAPDPRFELWVLDRPNEELRERIRERTRGMLEQGLVEETRLIRERYAGRELPRPLSAVGYAQVSAYLDGREPAGRKVPPGLAGLREEVELATRQLVKKQRTWFRGERASRAFVMDSRRPELLQRWRALYEEA